MVAGAGADSVGTGAAVMVRTKVERRVKKSVVERNFIVGRCDGVVEVCWERIDCEVRRGGLRILDEWLFNWRGCVAIMIYERGRWRREKKAQMMAGLTIMINTLICHDS